MKLDMSRFAAAAILLCVTTPVYAQSVEQGTAAVTPWSGWWWPAKTGNLVLGYRGEAGALVKHDQLTGKQASQWEQHTYYHFDPQGADWWGHCHAWAAASILEPQPTHDVYMGGMAFHVGEIKGLLSEAHYSDQATFYGQRYNGNPGDDFQDMHPLLVWYVLRKYLHDNQTPIVFDLNPGPEVWSYPAFKYQISFQPMGNGAYQGQLAIWVGSFEVYPDLVGTKTEEHDYTFTFQAQGNQLIAGSDRWTGASVQDHPDFAWYPVQRGQENPQLDYNFVSRLDQQAH
jgi:hypothetical protein